jgi:two-component system sensor histidine kinase/response regulator
VAGNIGATELQTLATELDGLVAERQDLPAALELSGRLKRQLAVVVAGIESQLSPAPARCGGAGQCPSTRLPASRRARSAPARGLLADDDPEAAELLSQHAELFKRQLGPAYRALDAGIRDFDFPAALQALRGSGAL